MTRTFARPMALVFFLLFATFIPIVSAALRMYQIPTGTLPDDAIKFTQVPFSIFMHALGGFLFGIIGPLQFAGALKRRFGKLHRWSGRVFVVAGLGLGLSSLHLLATFPDTSTWVLVTARAVAAMAMITAIGIALFEITKGRVTQHRAWMIRAYAIGMGVATISFIQLPIFLIRGRALEGYAADFMFVASWLINIAIAEWVIRWIATISTVKKYRR